MAKNIVICLDGTNNQLRSAVNTNVVRLFAMLDLDDATRQVGYYDPGVGTFSSPSAWTPPARMVSRLAGLAFGAGLRQNLGEAYGYLIQQFTPGDRIFLFGFSRGAYTARALAGMLDVFGIFRPGSENLVPYAVSAYARQQKRTGDDADSREFFSGLRMYARTHGTSIPNRKKDHVAVDFIGLWDTVKAAGTLTRQLRWPFTRQLPHAATVRHAVAIDEARRPFAEYLVHAPDPRHLLARTDQDLLEVWFAGVHSDVGGMFAEGTRLSNIPLKWMADQAMDKGLLLRRRAYLAAARLDDVDPAGDIHTNSPWWALLGRGGRTVPHDARVHASVAERVKAKPDYAARLPTTIRYTDPDWRKPRPNPQST